MSAEWQIDQGLGNLSQIIDWLHSQKEKIVDFEDIDRIVTTLYLRVSDIESLLEWLENKRNEV